MRFSPPSRPLLGLLAGVVFGTIGGVSRAQAELRLPTVFSDHMVLQRDMAAPIWGWAAAGETVQISGGGVTATAVADASGRWLARLGPLSATATPFEVTVSTPARTVTIKDVVVGDVWVCSGQSNMQWAVGSSSTWKEEEHSAPDPTLRLFVVRPTASLDPQDDVEKGAWQIASPATIKGFSAVGYYFGREISATQKIPVGLIGSSVGGTPAQSWIDPAGLASDPALEKFASIYRDTAAKREELAATYAAWLEGGGAEFLKAQAEWRAAVFQARKAGSPEPAAPKPHAPEPPKPNAFSTPTVLNNGMIKPLAPYGIKGAIWYQGESGGSPYDRLLAALITGWRRQWNQGDFPFFAVQLPNFRPSSGIVSPSGWPTTRHAIASVVESLPNAGMAVTLDVGETADLHPPHKRPVGHRLALAVRQKVYGEKIVGLSPTLAAKSIEGNTVRLTFKDVGAGLKIGVPDDPKPGTPARPVPDALQGFAVAGADKKWVEAAAEIVGPDTVAVSVPAGVNPPWEVAYGWSESPPVNLYNSGGLPAAPFRTDLNAR